MVKHTITNLHKSVASLGQDSDLIKSIRNKIGQIGDQISSTIPDLLGKLDLSENFELKKLKKKVLQKLEGKRKKFRLALESLGWGTLANLLEAAFCGEKLNIWV